MPYTSNSACIISSRFLCTTFSDSTARALDQFPLNRSPRHTLRGTCEARGIAALPLNRPCDAPATPCEACAEHEESQMYPRFNPAQPATPYEACATMANRSCARALIPLNRRWMTLDVRGVAGAVRIELDAAPECGAAGIAGWRHSMLGEVKGLGTILFHRILPMVPTDKLNEAIRKASRSFWFPDGSVYLEVPDQKTAVTVVSPNVAESIMEGRIEVVIYRSQAAFPLRWYALHYPMTYQNILGEDRFGACVGSGAKTWPGEQTLDRLEFTVWFKRKPAKQVRLAFRDVIRGWFASVANHGADDEGPIACADPNIVFCGRRADIVLDATRSGPSTLNYLILTTLEFGHSVAAVENAMINQDDPDFIATMVKMFAEQGQAFDVEAWRVKNRGGNGPTIRIPIFDGNEGSSL